jgi:phenylacetate-CoA ligase
MPPGQASRTALLTNLANCVQPLIRYDLGDCITVSPAPCSCCSPLPASRVEGRRKAILSFLAPDGQVIQLLPVTLSSLVEKTPGGRQFQVIQKGPATLIIRLEVVPGADGRRVWETIPQWHVSFG